MTQVLTSARDQFWDCSCTAASLDDLRSVTGLGKGSLYGTFGDKRQLFLHALGNYRGDQLSSVHQTLTGAGHSATSADPVTSSCTVGGEASDS
jgi:AcrR family transcriptional regulator